MNIVKDITVPILQLALPLILIQLCQALLGLVNTIVAGRYHFLDQKRPNDLGWNNH